MATRTKTSRKSTTRALARADWRDLLEFVQGTASPLKVDEDAGVIFRVKVLGRFSRNAHGQAGAENGSEYTAACMKSAVPMYEGAKVKANHPPDRSRPAAERDVDDTFGVLRNVLVEGDEGGDPAVWADLHYLKTHTMAPRVVEDVKRGLGVYGLSHNAAALRERFDPATRRLLIESLALVRSVDLVDKPATNRNLWESEYRPVTTLKSILTGRLAKLSKPRAAWARQLLEDETMPTDTPVEADAAPEEGDALWAGFWGEITAIGEKIKAGELDAATGGKQILKYLKTHESLTSEAEPEEPEEVEEEEEPKEKDKAESLELETLRAEKKVRQLCESLDFAPTQLQTDAIAGLKDDKSRRELIESFKGKPGGYRAPKSKSPIPAPKAGEKTKLESGAVDAAACLRVLMG